MLLHNDSILAFGINYLKFLAILNIKTKGTLVSISLLIKGSSGVQL